MKTIRKHTTFGRMMLKFRRKGFKRWVGRIISGSPDQQVGTREKKLFSNISSNVEWETVVVFSYAFKKTKNTNFYGKVENEENIII